jgi:hypothetical protein
MMRVLTLALLLACGQALAVQKQEFDGYTVHYNAKNSSELNPEVARRHRISRDPKLAMVMVTVQDSTGAAVSASMSGQARNLLGQVQLLEMREIREGLSIYYLGLFSISNRETQAFDFSIQPAGAAQGFKLGFSQQFFVD